MVRVKRETGEQSGTAPATVIGVDAVHRRDSTAPLWQQGKGRVRDDGKPAAPPKVRRPACTDLIYRVAAGNQRHSVCLLSSEAGRSTPLHARSEYPNVLRG